MHTDKNPDCLCISYLCSSVFICGFILRFLRTQPSIIDRSICKHGAVRFPGTCGAGRPPGRRSGRFASATQSNDSCYSLPLTCLLLPVDNLCMGRSTDKEEGRAIPDPQSPQLLEVRPRHSLQRKLVLWTFAMVGVPMLLCAVLFNNMTHRALRDTQARNAEMLSQALATTLGGQLDDGWSPQSHDTLDALFLERRLAFVIVTDPREAVLHRRSIDSQAWATFTEQTGVMGLTGSIPVDTPLFAGAWDEIVVRRTPIWNTNFRTDSGRKLEGFVVLGLHERTLPATLGDLRWAQLAAAGALILIALPFIWSIIRHWTAPLRALMVATVRLGDGHAPPPVKVRSRDEVGLLSESFNKMAQKLFTTQSQLIAANEELERKVELRTTQIGQVNERLEAEIREKNEFLRAVSHDLGAPLRNIEGMAGMLLAKYRSQLADDATTKLERISANVKVQIELLNDLMELSRIRTRPGKREQVNLNILMTELRDNLSYDLEASRITLSIAANLPTVTGERNRMRQVFQNLLDNAVKYMLQATDRSIAVSHQMHEGQHLFTIADTGCGIALEDQPKVFDVFRRATHSGSHHVAGRGVGLASVKAIIETYGGRIWLESEQGKGTSFHFTLNADNATQDMGQEIGNRRQATGDRNQ